MDEENEEGVGKVGEFSKVGADTAMLYLALPCSGQSNLLGSPARRPQ